MGCRPSGDTNAGGGGGSRPGEPRDAGGPAMKLPFPPATAPGPAVRWGSVSLCPSPAALGPETPVPTAKAPQNPQGSCVGVQGGAGAFL